MHMTSQRTRISNLTHLNKLEIYLLLIIFVKRILIVFRLQLHMSKAVMLIASYFELNTIDNSGKVTTHNADVIVSLPRLQKID
jgi:hypothetical protein